MGFEKTVDTRDFVLMEAGVVETLRRRDDVRLHPRLENALLIYDKEGENPLSRIYQGFIRVAREGGIPIALCTPTWRANRARTSESEVARDVNGDAVSFLKRLRERQGAFADKILIGGLIGCKNDCYRSCEGLSVDEAKAFHRWQIHRLAEAGPDFLLAATLPALPEATGISLAMAETGLPYLISFVIDRKGRILDGNRLEYAFDRIDAICEKPPFGYMVNCAYPDFLNADQQPEAVLSRLIGYQANASALDHAQLDGSETLRAEEISDWGDLMIALNRKFGVKILGGCCGTGCDHLRYVTDRITGKPLKTETGMA